MSSENEDNNQLDTGTGGFPVESNLHHYDIGVEDEGGGNPVKWNRGTINTNVGGDISNKTKKTLSSYLSKATQGNYYPVSSEHSEIKLTEVDGSPAKPSNPSSQGYFNAKQADFSTLRSVSEYYTKAELDKSFVKGRGSWDKQNGNSVLSTVKPVEGTGEVDANLSPVVSKYSNAIINNRFSKGSFESRLTNSEGNLKEKVFYDPRTLKMGEAPDQSLDDNYQFSFGRLSQIGGILMARSSYELGSFAANNVPGDAAAILPGLTQMGVARVHVSELEVKNVISDLTTDDLDPDFLVDPSRFSWGSLNNNFDRFGGVSNLGMQLLTIAMSLAIGLLFAVFTVGFTSSPKPLEPSTGIMPMGSWKEGSGPASVLTAGGIVKAISSGTFRWTDLLGLYNPAYPYVDCLVMGFLTFLGAHPDESLGAGFGMGLMKLIPAIGEIAIYGSQNPGYNLVMMRSIMRSIYTIVDAFKASAQATDAVGVLKQVLELISVLRESRIMRSMNVFVTVGDALLSENASHKTIDKISQIDANEDYNGPGPSAVTKSRLRGKGKSGSQALAWSTYRAIDRIILPNSTINSILMGGMGAPRILGSERENLRKIGENKIDPYAPEDSGRISTAERELFENYLDSEYVPFYFHDVRTNEIVSFHAFLASLNDGFSANYDTVDAIGRVDPIKIYKNTSRKMSFSFYVAALSKNDFDSMWIKINKLTTMIYPQFTEGLYVENGDYRYVAPFSQQFSASPLTRVRIGDLVRSNYSRYNLAKLFGYGNADTKFDGKSGAVFNSAKIEVGAIQESLEKQKGAKSNYFYVPVGELKINGFVPDSAADLSLTPSVEPGSMPFPTGLLLKVITDSEAGRPAECQIYLPEDDELAPFGLINNEKLKEKYDNEANLEEKIVGRKILVDKGKITMTSPSYMKFMKTESGAGSEYSAAVSEFMVDDPAANGKGNLIAKSFRTVGGKGLAGFIESMDFDWMEKVTWETDEIGKKAPKMCKITISFAPIHDIAPGLDHKGTNRAPVYPVGPYAQRGR